MNTYQMHTLFLPLPLISLSLSLSPSLPPPPPRILGGSPGPLSSSPRHCLFGGFPASFFSTSSLWSLTYSHLLLDAWMCVQVCECAGV